MHQAKTWIVVGITTIIDRGREEDERHRRHPGREHVVRPDAEADEDDEQLGDRDEREGDHPPLRERRDDRRRDPERGHDEDVDLGVAEDPEEVLPEQRRRRRARRRRSGSRRCAASSRKTRSTVSDGSAKSSRSDAARIAKQKSGIRFSDIPGARSLKIVTMKLAAASVDEIAVEDQRRARRSRCSGPGSYCLPARAARSRTSPRSGARADEQADVDEEARGRGRARS